MKKNCVHMFSGEITSQRSLSLGKPWPLSFNLKLLVFSRHDYHHHHKEIRKLLLHQRPFAWLPFHHLLLRFMRSPSLSLWVTSCFSPLCPSRLIQQNLRKRRKVTLTVSALSGIREIIVNTFLSSLRFSCCCGGWVPRLDQWGLVSDLLK